jgi:hypothetical protein
MPAEKPRDQEKAANKERPELTLPSRYRFTSTKRLELFPNNAYSDHNDSEH